MSWPWASPEATRTGIAQRVRARHPSGEIQLRLYEVAFRRLLARLEVASPGRWVLKGGVALLLRLDPSRTSNDIDLVYRTTEGTLSEPLTALDQAFAVDLGDFFAFELAATPAEDAQEGDETLPLRVDALIGGRLWVTFGVDLGVADSGIATDPVRAREDLTGLAQVDSLPELRALTIAHQVAQKGCALFESHGDPPKHSTRARDLIDVAMVADQVEDIEAQAIDGYMRSEEAKRIESGRLRGPLPGRFGLPGEQIADWRRRWSKATRGAAMSFDTAYELVELFLDPVLSRTAQGTWSPGARRWS
jgi:hypothetical protein